ncbi:MAG: tetratricopeptide repeat protein [Rhodanobacteraceae bacterium]
MIDGRGLAPPHGIDHTPQAGLSPAGWDSVVAKLRTCWWELKRRNVLRAGVLYAAAAWLLVQIATQVFPFFDIPEWVVRWIVVAVVIGAPFWLALAWFYELTPEGLKRESEVAPHESIARSTGRKLDYAIIAVLSIVIVLLVTNQFVMHRDVTSAADAADTKAIVATLAKLPQKSIAVLPLINESGDPKQQYFADGLSEELISDLAQINGLKVIGKYSSFKFRDSKDSPAQIGATLGVAHLLEGSVRQQGNRLRVMVTLIGAKDGTVVWSHTYDQQLKDVFAIQTQIGVAVAAALKIRLLGQTLGVDDKPRSGNVEAYQLMLQGRAAARHGTEADYRQGIALYQEALKVDPNYAYAWGSLSVIWINLGTYNLTGDARQQAYAKAQVAVDKQDALAPDTAATHVNRGYLLSVVDNDPVGALAEFRRGYALAPNDGNIMSFLSGGFQLVGQLQPAAELMRKAIATDPLRTDWYNNLAQVLLGQGQLGAAEQAVRKAMILQPDYPQLYAILAQIDIIRGDAAAAVRDAKQETDPVQGPWAQALAQQIGSDRQQADEALRNYLVRNGKNQPYNVADLYALRKQSDDMFHWLQRAWMQHDPNFAGLLSDPFVLPYQHDPRFAVLCQQLGLPLPAPAGARGG